MLDNLSGENEDMDTAKLVEKFTKLRKEIRQQDKLYRNELRKIKEEFSTALAEVQYKLQILTLQFRSESCSQNSYKKIFHEIQSLCISITTAEPTNNFFYTDIVCISPNSYPSNIRIFLSFNTIPTIFTDTLYCTIDTSKIIDNKNNRISTGLIRAAVETKI